LNIVYAIELWHRRNLRAPTTAERAGEDRAGDVELQGEAAPAY